MDTPPEVMSILEAFDARTDTFSVHDVHHAVTRAIQRDQLSDQQRPGFWAEMAAFGFDTHPAPNGGPWHSYFQPAMAFTAQDGTPIYGPDIAEATAATIEYWATRAKKVVHPVLAARYAGLVWDFSRHVTTNAPQVEFAHLAIDSYLSSLRLDEGENWGDNFYNLRRVLALALSIKDSQRVVNTVQAIIDYADRTADDAKLGTYCYLFDLLLPPKKAPPLSVDQETQIVARFESRFAEMTKPGGEYDADPHSPQEIGLLLAGYFKRNGRDEKRVAILIEIAKAFERRAKMGDAMSGLLFLDEARQFYVEAGNQSEAERVLRESQELAPEAKKGMAQHTVEFEIPDRDREKFLDQLIADGVKQGLVNWAVGLLPRQADLKAQLEELAKQYPLQALFAPTILGEEGVRAKVGDPRGDPDGRMIHETAKRLALSAMWLSWGLDHLLENGLTPELFVDFIAESPVYLKDRMPLIQRGIEAHMHGDYIQSIHVLLPQIERALVS